MASRPPARRPGSSRPPVRRPATAGRPGVGEGPIRLTRRGRLVLVVTVAAALLVALWVTAGPGEEAGASQKTVPRAVVVEPGDTLWSIASRALPGVDPRLAVDRIVRLNRLPETIVFPGQRLVLPAR